MSSCGWEPTGRAVRAAPGVLGCREAQWATPREKAQVTQMGFWLILMLVMVVAWLCCGFSQKHWEDKNGLVPSEAGGVPWHGSKVEPESQPQATGNLSDPAVGRIWAGPAGRGLGRKSWVQRGICEMESSDVNPASACSLILGSRLPHIGTMRGRQWEWVPSLVRLLRTAAQLRGSVEETGSGAATHHRFGPQEIVDWFNALRAARFHYLQVAFPGASDADVSGHPRVTGWVGEVAIWDGSQG